jgi:hypothetical protein
VRRLRSLRAGVLCLVGLFVAATLGTASMAQAAPGSGDASGLLSTPETMTVNAETYYVVDNPNTFFQNYRNTKCIGVSGGSNVNGAPSVQWECQDKLWSDQHMYVWRPDPDDIWHKIAPMHVNGKCLGISAADDDPGISLIQWLCTAGHEQQFAFRVKPAGFEIVVRHTWQCIGVSGSSLNDGGRLVQWPCNNGGEQRWYFRL